MKLKITYCAIALLFMASISSTAMAAPGSSGRSQALDQGASLLVAANQSQMNEQQTGAIKTEAQQDAQKTIQMATFAINQMAADRKIPEYVFDHAKGIVIIPHVVKAGLIVGGRWGRGVLMTKDQQGQWSLPVFVTLGGASIGAQIGAEQSDLLLVFNDEFAIQKLLQSNNFNLGADASVAAGPMGAKAKTATTSAEVLSYQRTKGLFAGLDLTGGVLHVDANPTIAYYRLNEPSAQAYFGQNKTQMAENILNANKSNKSDQTLFRNVPESAENLRSALDQLTGQ